MSITLPASPAPRSVTLRLNSRRADMEPLLGGPTTRIQRLGSRWSMDVELPPMSYLDAMAWVAALTKAEADTVVMAIPQPGFDTGAPGTPLVNGSSQLGKTLVIDGLGAYTFKAGQMISLITSSRRYVHQVSADTAAVSGGASLPIEPMIRKAPSNNAVVEVAAPKIEGYLAGRDQGWTVDVARLVGLAFTITERE
jgi:hypothetical protein